MVEPITEYLKRRLKEAGAARFPAIAASTGVAESFIKKFVYGSRQNPRIQTIQPLLDLFAAIERGERGLPGDVVAIRVPGGYTGPERRQRDAGSLFPDLDRRTASREVA